MREDDLVEPFGVEEIYVDGFSDHVINGSNMTCIGYRIHKRPSGKRLKVAKVRLIWPASSTEEAIADARQAQAAPAEIVPLERLKRH